MQRGNMLPGAMLPPGNTKRGKTGATKYHERKNIARNAVKHDGSALVPVSRQGSRHTLCF